MDPRVLSGSVHTAMSDGTVFGGLDEYDYSSIALLVIIVSALFLLLLCVRIFSAPPIAPILALQEPLQPTAGGESETFHGGASEVEQTQDYV